MGVWFSKKNKKKDYELLFTQFFNFDMEYLKKVKEFQVKIPQ